MRTCCRVGYSSRDKGRFRYFRADAAASGQRSFGRTAVMFRRSWVGISRNEAVRNWRLKFTYVGASEHSTRRAPQCGIPGTYGHKTRSRQRHRMWPSKATGTRTYVRTCVGIPSDFQVVKQQEKYTAEAAAANTIARVVGALPLVIPALGDRLDIDALLSRVDGLMIPGGISNVHPALYGARANEEKGPFDPKRDATTLPLIRAALERGVPLLMTCRGFQELNV